MTGMKKLRADTLDVLGSSKLKTLAVSEAVAFGSNGAKILSGAGSPEGVVVAGVASLYLRTDGGANTCLYVKQSGSANSGWVGK